MLGLPAPSGGTGSDLGRVRVGSHSRPGQDAGKEQGGLHGYRRHVLLLLAPDAAELASRSRRRSAALRVGFLVCRPMTKCPTVGLKGGA